MRERIPAEKISTTPYRELLAAYEGVLHRVAASHLRSNVGLDWDDVYQECRIALLTAQERFDHTRSRRFSSFLAFILRSHLLRCTHTPHLHLPVPVRRLIRRFAKLRVLLGKEGYTESEADALLIEWAEHGGPTDVSSAIRHAWDRFLGEQWSGQSMIAAVDIARTALGSTEAVDAGMEHECATDPRGELIRQIDGQRLLARWMLTLSSTDVLIFTMHEQGHTMDEIAADLFSRGLKKRTLTRQGIKSQIDRIRQELSEWLIENREES